MTNQSAFNEYTSKRAAKAIKAIEDRIQAEAALDFARKSFTASKTIGAFVDKMQADGAWEQVKALKSADLL